MKISRSHIEKKAAKLSLRVLHRCKPAESIAAKDIHDLRTSAKKLDALLQLLVFVNGDRNHMDRVLEPFQRLFKVMGKIRKMQLLLHSFRRVKTLDKRDKKAIKDILSQRKIKATKAYRKLLANDIKHKLKKAIASIHKIVKHADFEDADKYFPHQKKKLEEIISVKELQGDDVHHARMLLKEVFYNAKLVKIKGKIPMLSVTVKDVDQQLLRLGDWHDLYINQQEYSALLNDKKNKWQNISLMKKLEQSLTKKEALTRRQMIAQLRAIARSRTS